MARIPTVFDGPPRCWLGAAAGPRCAWPLVGAAPLRYRVIFVVVCFFYGSMWPWFRLSQFRYQLAKPLTPTSKVCGAAGNPTPLLQCCGVSRQLPPPSPGCIGSHCGMAFSPQRLLSRAMIAEQRPLAGLLPM